MPMTSTGAERLFARGRAHDIRAGASRDDTRAGVILGHADGTARAWMRERADGEKEWKLLRKRARQGFKVTMLEKRTAAGLAQQEMRKAKLAATRAKRAAKATECARIDALPLAEHYSVLKLMSVEDLRNQPKKHELLGKTGFALLCPTRRTCCSCKRSCFSRPTRTRTTSRTTIPASTDAAFGAARLSEAGSTDAGCAPTWATSEPRRRRRLLRWRLSSARVWPRAASHQASSSTASSGRYTHQTWCGMTQVRTCEGSELLRELESVKGHL
eukprot:1565798-Pleurochrysis_carterae.AAC.1